MADFQVKIGCYSSNGKQIFVNKNGLPNLVKWEQTFEFYNRFDAYSFAIKFAKTFGEAGMVIAVYYKNSFIYWYCGEPVCLKMLQEEE